MKRVDGEIMNVLSWNSSMLAPSSSDPKSARSNGLGISETFRSEMGDLALFSNCSSAPEPRATRGDGIRQTQESNASISAKHANSSAYKMLIRLPALLLLNTSWLRKL